MNRMVNDLKESFGEEIVEPVEIKTIPFSCSNIDNDLLGIGGIPQNRITEIYGQPSTGKTTLSLILCREAQKTGNTCLYIDCDNSINPDHVNDLGVGGNIIFSQENKGEKVIKMVERSLKSKNIDLIVIDSIPSMDTDYPISRLIHEKIERIADLASSNKKTILLVNQTRRNMNEFGKAIRTVGGNGITEFSALRIHLKKSSRQIKEDNEVVGDIILMRTDKNNLFKSAKTSKIKLIYKKGIENL